MFLFLAVNYIITLPYDKKSFLSIKSDFFSNTLKLN